MARLEIRVNGRMRFSSFVEDSFEFKADREVGGSVSVQATVAPRPVKAVAAVKPTRPVAPKPDPVAPKPEPVAPKPEPEVVTPVEVTEPESGGGAEGIDGGTVDPESGVITDPASGEVVGLVDSETGEVTDQSGEVVGTLDQETGQVTDEVGEVVATVEVEEN